MTLIPHHYHPPTIQLPHYAANTSSVISLIVQFGILWAAVLAVAILIVRRVHPSASRSDQLAFLWMCLTGCIHLFFEAYFVLNHETLAGSATLFGQLWKEYSLSDSRYLTSDAFLVAMEAVTAFAWGPLSFLIAYCIAVQHPCRHALQLIVSLGQIYGDVLYFATSLFGEHFHGVLFCRPEGYYFWFYYFFFNILWIVIPSCFLVQSVREITGAFRKLAEIGGAGAGRNGKKDI